MRNEIFIFINIHEVKPTFMWNQVTACSHDGCYTKLAIKWLKLELECKWDVPLSSNSHESSELKSVSVFSNKFFTSY